MLVQPWAEPSSTPGVTRAPGVADEDLVEAEAALGRRLPPALRGLYRATNGLRDDEAQLQVIWTLEQLLDSAAGEWGAGLRAAGLVAFGDDGAGEWFCVRRDTDSAVFAWYFIDEEAHEVATSLADFWTRWVSGQGVPT